MNFCHKSAGDLLPDPTMAQLIATGFVRMNPTTAEGGVVFEEFQAKNNFDRVETLGTALLGMSLPVLAVIPISMIRFPRLSTIG